jgi:hypothetical protein
MAGVPQARALQAQRKARVAGAASGQPGARCAASGARPREPPPPPARLAVLSVAIMRFFIVRLLSPATALTTCPAAMLRAALMPYTDLVHRNAHSLAWR